MEVFLIRHPKPAIEKDIIYGSLDVSLANGYKKDLDICLEKLPKNIKTIYSSPLKRCKDSASYLQEKLPFSNIIEDTRLQEINFGDWEGKTWSSITPNELNNWMYNFVDVAPPNGENLHQLHTRVSDFYDEMILNAQEPIVIVAHAGSIRCILAIVKKINLASIFDIKIGYGEMILL